MIEEEGGRPVEGPAGQMLQRLRSLLGRLRPGTVVPVWYDPAYRLPLASVEARTGIEPRRADVVAFHLLDAHVVPRTAVSRPEPIRWADLARVHEPALLESLGEVETLARIFAVDASDVPVGELLNTIRLACGGTLAAARQSLRARSHSLNLLGGFHHAGRRSAGALCAVNDIAVTVGALRAEGYAGRVVVLDLDAHPPDGTADCLSGDERAWIGSLSGSDWGRLDGVDETVLPRGCADDAYLAALGALLGRMPRADLGFVIAGGDVLDGDRMGCLGLSLDGARRRDLRVRAALSGVATVWLPGGGYHSDAWKVLSGTALALARRSREPIPPGYDPLRTRFASVAATLRRGELEGELSFTMDDVMADLDERRPTVARLLGFYTAAGIEYALQRYGILEHIERLGYSRVRVRLDLEGGQQRMCVLGRAEGAEYLLVDCVLERTTLAGARVLYVHWLAMQDPRARFDERRPMLPGQQHPGLGLAREAGELLIQMARRLELEGVAFRPASYHMAYMAREQCRFVDPRRQGRFDALVRDLGHVPLLEATAAVAEGRVAINGRRYDWEADGMVHWLDGREPDPELVAAERSSTGFTITDRA